MNQESQAGVDHKTSNVHHGSPTATVLSYIAAPTRMCCSCRHGLSQNHNDQSECVKGHGEHCKKNHLFKRNVTQEEALGEHAWKGYKAFTEDTINISFARISF